MAETRKCPHCNVKLTLREAIWILNGSGYKSFAKCKTSDGAIHIADAGQIDPNIVEVLEADD